MKILLRGKYGEVVTHLSTEELDPSSLCVRKGIKAALKLH